MFTLDHRHFERDAELRVAAGINRGDGKSGYRVIVGNRVIKFN